jgi:hypothetical protein
VDACLDSGFHLNNGVKVSGGDGVLLVGGEAFAWRPWMAKEGAENNLAARDSMLNAKGQIELDESVWGVLNLVWPKPGMFIFLKKQSVMIWLVLGILLRDFGDLLDLD